MYSEKVLDHFTNPRNVGDIPDADGIGEEGNPVCGDMMTFYIKVRDDRLVDVKFKTFGCGAAIAVSSMVSEMAKGKTLDDAMLITNASVAEALDGLPKQKLHCSNLGADALHRAIEDYYKRGDARPEAQEETLKSLDQRLEERFGQGLSGINCDVATQEQEQEQDQENALCPYCNAPIDPDDPICGPCGNNFKLCAHCGTTAKYGATHCATCGSELTRD